MIPATLLFILIAIITVVAFIRLAECDDTTPTTHTTPSRSVRYPTGIDHDVPSEITFWSNGKDIRVLHGREQYEQRGWFV